MSTQAEIQFSPGGIEHGLAMTDITGALVEFSRTSLLDGATQVSSGGVAVSVTHDMASAYTVGMETLVYPDGTGPNNDLFYHRLTAFRSFAEGGGEFEFLMDKNNTFNQTLTNAEANGATLIEVASTTGLASGDTVYFEDADDITKFEEARVTTPITATAFTLTTGLVWAYVSGSTVRDHEYFPTCVLWPRRVDFSEVRGGQGANRYRISFTFRTVR